MLTKFTDAITTPSAPRADNTTELFWWWITPAGYRRQEGMEKLALFTTASLAFYIAGFYYKFKQAHELKQENEELKARLAAHRDQGEVDTNPARGAGGS